MSVNFIICFFLLPSALFVFNELKGGEINKVSFFTVGFLSWSAMYPIHMLCVVWPQTRSTVQSKVKQKSVLPEYGNQIRILYLEIFTSKGNTM